jgi:hypothetical protein
MPSAGQKLRQFGAVPGDRCGLAYHQTDGRLGPAGRFVCGSLDLPNEAFQTLAGEGAEVLPNRGERWGVVRRRGDVV